MLKYGVLLLVMIGCGGSIAPKPMPVREQQSVSKESFWGLKEDTIAGMPVTLVKDSFEGNAPIANLLVLPGWDFERHRWLLETNLREYAKQHHFLLILPEMKRSIYATHFYPETTLEARKEKTGTWLIDTFLPAIQNKYQVLLPGQTNMVLGLSTGGRGAVYCAWKCPKVFVAAASLSGDFNQTWMPRDYLMTSVYGPFDKYQSRWMHDDNLYEASDSITIPVFIGHGRNDKVVPFAQSQKMAEKMKATHPKTQSLFVEVAGHDFKFWGQALPAVFDFFETVENSEK